jgi:hypothetical protein
MNSASMGNLPNGCTRDFSGLGRTCGVVVAIATAGTSVSVFRQGRIYLWLRPQPQRGKQVLMVWLIDKQFSVPGFQLKKPDAFGCRLTCPRA